MLSGSVDVSASNSGNRFANWRLLAERQPVGVFCGRDQRAWRELTRGELGLPVDRPVIATGHQTLLWHPGILAKYIARDAAARACGFAQANLIVDQHVGDFGEFDAPIRNENGSLDVMRIRLTDARPNVPMALHSAFAPHDPPADLPRDAQYATESVARGVERIIAAIRAHADAPSAAIQMGRALSDLMQRWVSPAKDVTATALCETTLGSALMQHMAEDPRRCAEAYNRAVAAVPEAGIPPLAVHRDEVEVPLWRIGGDGARMRAHAGDLPRAGSTCRVASVIPRALFMTALVRLGMCDLFIHGTGGAAYDRAMELWIRDWLGIEVAPIAVVTADLRLPLLDNDAPPDVEAVRHEARHLWHDPQRDSDGTISAAKRAMLEEIAHLPRRSAQRKQAFYHMHERLEAMRNDHRAEIASALSRIEHAARRAADAAIAARRDWAFPLYPEAMIDELARSGSTS